MRDRRVPPNARHTKLVSLRRLPSFARGVATSQHLCIASSTHPRNSCASSCRPLRNVFETDRRFLTSARGAIALRAPPSACSPPPSARQMCSPISYTASNPPPPPRLLPRALRCSPARQNEASGGVCVRHCVTAFRKQVFPRLARPAPTLRTEGQRVEKCADERGYRGFGTSSSAPSSSLTPSSSRRSRDSPRGGWPFASARASCRASRTIMRLCASSEIRGGSARLRSERSGGRERGETRDDRGQRARDGPRAIANRKVSARRRRRRNDTRHHERCSVLLGRGDVEGAPGTRALTCTRTSRARTRAYAGADRRPVPGARTATAWRVCPLAPTADFRPPDSGARITRTPLDGLASRARHRGCVTRHATA